MDTLPSHLTLRNLDESDHPDVIKALRDWWGGRDLTKMLPRLFLVHFCDTSFAVCHDAVLIAFLVGFFSQSRKNEAYIHFAGVHPEYRGQGMGRFLYMTFFDLCKRNNKIAVRSCTSPVNVGSIAFHKSMGFILESGDSFINNISVTSNYNRPDDPKVLFYKSLG